MGGAYISPLSSPRSFKSTYTASSNTWVSPLDVHFSRSTTPTANDVKTPISYLPQLHFAREMAQSGLLIPSQDDFVLEVKPDSTSTFSIETSPSIAQRSIFPVINDSERPTSRRSNRHFDNASISPLPQTPSCPSPRSPTLNQTLYPENTPVSAGSALIHESVVRKQSVSTHSTQSSDGQSPDVFQTHGLPHDTTALLSGVYSASKTSVVDHELISTKRSCSSDPVAKQRDRSGSMPQKRSRSSHNLARTRDSVRQHAGRISQESTKVDKRRRDREQINHNTTQNYLNWLGLKDDLLIPTRPTNLPSRIAVRPPSGLPNPRHPSRHPQAFLYDTLKTNQFPKPFLELEVPTAHRLSAMTARAHKGPSASDVSQASIGDFYDSYYRQSVLV